MLPSIEFERAFKWGAAFLLVIILGLLGLSFWAGVASADDDPPSTVLQMCRGSLPSLSLHSNADAGCVTFTVSATSKTAPDYLSKGGDNEWRHVYAVSGAPCCVGTGSLSLEGRDVSSGRDCDPAEGAYSQCAYLAEGYRVFAVTGGSCSSLGIDACQGLFCR